MGKNRYVLILAVFILMLSSFSASADEDIKVIVNNNRINFDTQPFIYDDRTLVPIRAITEAMDFDVNWDGVQRVAVISNSEKTVTIPIDSHYINIDDYLGRYRSSDIYIDVPALIKNDRTYLPLRALSEAFGAEVDWIGKSRTVEIEYEPPIVVTFQDKGFEKAVRNSLDLNNGAITERMLHYVTNLYAGYDDDEIKIESIEDISKLPELTYIDLRDQDVTDISPLLYKKNWNYVGLSGLTIKDDDILDSISADDIDFPNIEMYWSGTNYRKGLNLYRKTMDAVSDVLSQCNKKGMSDYEKYRALHDYLVTHMEYDYDYVYSDETEGESDICIALLDGKGVCSVYASTYRQLCNMCGLECIEVDGEADGITHVNEKSSWQGHAWNIVKLEGNYYHVDVTWDDPLTDWADDDDYVSHEYFLLSDEQLKQYNDHRWDTSDVPKCKKEYDGYINKTENEISTPAPYTPNEDEQEQEYESNNENDNSVVSFDVEEYVDRVIDIVNEERAAVGLALLKKDETLNHTAQQHSDDMAEHSFFDHINLDGKSPFDRLADNDVSYMYAGENIAWGQKSPEDVVDSWMHSEGHRENILSANFRKIGVGIAQNSHDTFYWTQVFTD